MADRPTDYWREGIEDEARDVASGALDPECAVMAGLFPESLLSRTDKALAAFESDVRMLSDPADEQVFQTIERLVLALNTINDDYGGAAYETGEREELCQYIDETIEESGVDVAALTARHGLSRWALTDRWRRW
jgi:hypothetical protein